MANEKIKLKRRLQERRKKIENTKYTNTYIKPVYIAITRFNEKTWNENVGYRKRYNLNGCLYGSPIQISHTIPLKSIVYVIEMNNTTNKIVGIGKIINVFNTELHNTHAFKIYGDYNYSRYVYYGEKHIDKVNFSRELNNICDFLEWFMFRGYGPLDKPRRGTHYKRGMGINKLPAKILYSYYNYTLTLDRQIEYYFEQYFRVL
jgi:hypothetical protein